MSWLWKNDTSSPASFEKALSKLTTQINAANVSLDSTRNRSRRFQALWTLYTTLSYLLYSLVITLVLGPKEWSIPHYAGLVGGPVVIYLVRRGFTTFFDWRIHGQQRHIANLQKQRESKINDLKKATKYDSTQELLTKYGGAPKQTPSKAPQQGTKRKINPPPQPGRTGIAPPPTANIPSRNVSGISTPQRPYSASGTPLLTRPQSPLLSAGAHAPSPTTISPDEPGFAPNAYTWSQPIQEAPPHHWYDRILDVMIGEDETLAKNRLALICSNCRLVNGQAPPGVKTLEEIGRWRCASCKSWNGVESAAAKVIQEMVEQKAEENGWEKTSHEASKDIEVKPVKAISEEGKPETTQLLQEESDEDDKDNTHGDIGSDPADDKTGSTVTKQKAQRASKRQQED